jgi:hypothetical protein
MIYLCSSEARPEGLAHGDTVDEIPELSQINMSTTKKMGFSGQTMRKIWSGVNV